MNIELTEKEFRRLLDMVYIGNWILNACREDDRFEDYDDLEEKLFSLCPEHGMAALCELWEGHIYPSRAFEEGGIHEAIADYEDAVFYDILAEELARRDMSDEQISQNDTEELAERMEEYYDEFEENGIDMIVLAGFMAILSAGFVSRYPERIINIHPSLIPSFCGEGFYGLRVHQAALDYGVKVTGATVHYVNEIPDGGRIIAQKAVEIQPDDTPETLQRRVMEQAEWILLPRAAEEVAKEIGIRD